MSDISVGAVGAAIIAGLVSLLGLIIGKEQKVSEFRQAWIDDLRKNMVSYLVNINAISDTVRSRKPDSSPDNAGLIASYKALNEAHHGIILRVNPEEQASKAILRAMEDFDELAKANASLTPERLKAAEENFLAAAKTLLKFEWKRVKRGENTFVWTKRVVTISIVSMAALMIALWWFGNKETGRTDQRHDGSIQLLHS